MYLKLTKFQRAVLITIRVIAGKHGHYTIGKYSRHFPKEQRGLVKKTIEKDLKKKRLVQAHPTKGGITWQLTEYGWKIANDEISRVKND